MGLYMDGVWNNRCGVRDSFTLWCLAYDLLICTYVTANKMKDDYKAVLDFWFVELKPEQHFLKDPSLDSTIRKRFLNVHAKAAKGELHHWRQSPEGAVAEIILLDQMSRNIYRGTPLSFACDPVALTIAQQVVDSGGLDKLPPKYQELVLMPYMHSESKVLHDEAVVLRAKYKLDNTWEIKHRNIIDRFGRYPHRNIILGRQSTAEEIKFLKQPDSSF